MWKLKCYPGFFSKNTVTTQPVSESGDLCGGGAATQIRSYLPAGLPMQ